MSNIIEVVKALPQLLPLKAATLNEITDAELQLKLTFADEYKEYLSVFGAIIADGIELSGIAKSEHRNVVTLTMQERVLNPNVPHSMYVLENARVDGIIIWQDSKGRVFISSPNEVPKQIATSLVEYIKSKEVSERLKK